MNNKDYIKKFEAECNKTVISGEFAFDANVSFPNNTTFHNDEGDLFICLGDNVNSGKLEFTFARDGKPAVEFYFSARNINTNELMKIVSSLLK